MRRLLDLWRTLYYTYLKDISTTFLQRQLLHLVPFPSLVVTLLTIQYPCLNTFFTPHPTLAHPAIAAAAPAITPRPRLKAAQRSTR